MSSFVPVKLTWKDNSSGAQDETGQEVEIYTDSPSFKPNVGPIVYSEAPHPWMRLPPIAAGEVEMTISLQAPITFLSFRVRQYNANGPGSWSAPVNLPIAVPAGSGVPPAPSGLGGAVVGAVDPPPPPPVDPPPPPPPTGGGGASSNYSFVDQFSGVQGGNQWSYRDGNGNDLVYSSTNQKWDGPSDLYLAIWNGGFHHGWSLGTSVVLRWTAPADGEINIKGSHKLFQGSGGATFTIKKNTTQIYQQAMTNATEYFYDIDETITAGQYIDFILSRDVSGVNNNTLLNPVIQLTTDGTTAQNPVLSGIAPPTLLLSIGGAGSLLAELASPAIEAATVTLANSDAGKATVPASAIIPLGQKSVIIPVVGLSQGDTTVTATYNSVSKQSIVSVSPPISSTWKNAIPGGVVLLNTDFATKNGLLDVYGSTILTTDVSAPLSPPSVAVARLEAFALHGGNQLQLDTPIGYREMYFGLYWRTNPQFQGRTVGNKLFFLSRSEGLNGVFLFHNTKLVNGAGDLLFSPNTDGISNAHILPGSDPGIPFTCNAGNGTLRVGSWTKIEGYIRASSTRTSRDGILRAWINDTLVMSYTNINYCGPNGETLSRWMQTQTWDGALDMGSSNTVAWEHYLDHLYIVGKN